MRDVIFFLLEQRGSGGGQLHFGSISGKHSGLISGLIIGSCGLVTFVLDGSEITPFLVGLLKSRHQQVYWFYFVVCD